MALIISGDRNLANIKGSWDNVIVNEVVTSIFHREEP